MLSYWEQGKTKKYASTLAGMARSTFPLREAMLAFACASGSVCWASAATCGAGNNEPACRAPGLFEDAKLTTWIGADPGGRGRWNTSSAWSDSLPCKGVAVLPESVRARLSVRQAQRRKGRPCAPYAIMRIPAMPNRQRVHDPLAHTRHVPCTRMPTRMCAARRRQLTPLHSRWSPQAQPRVVRVGATEPTLTGVYLLVSY